MGIYVLRNYVLILILLFFCGSCKSDSTACRYTEYYDLDFKRLFARAEDNYANVRQKDGDVPEQGEMSRWAGSYESSYGMVTLPSSLLDKYGTESGLHFLKASPEIKGYFSISQRILLPENLKGKLRIVFSGSGEGIGKITIKTVLSDSHEKVVRTEESGFHFSSREMEYSLETMVEDSYMMDLMIELKEFADESKFLPSSIKIFINNKDINRFPLVLPDNPVQRSDIKAKVFRQDDKEHFVPEMFGKNRIIGIGESVHNNPQVTKFAEDLLLEIVRNYNCKLILLEGTFENVLSYNRYISHPNHKLDTLYFPKPSLRYLLDSLRDYNIGLDSNEKKVRIGGIDYGEKIDSPYFTTEGRILDYISRLNMNSRNKALHNFCALLIDDIENHSCEASEYLSNHIQEVSGILDGDEVADIIHILKVSTLAGRDPIERFSIRDSVMADNAEYFINKYQSDDDFPVAIFAHISHLNVCSSYPFNKHRPVGLYLKQKYDDYYSPFCITKEAGILNCASGEKVLNTPPKNSFESILGTFAANDEIVFVSMSKEFDKVLNCRYVGNNAMNKQFFPTNPYSRFAGAFHIKGNYPVDSSFFDNQKYKSFETRTRLDSLRKDRYSSTVRAIRNH